MSDALVGHTGFVGGNLIRQHEFAALYNSKNIGDIRGRAFDTIVFSGAQAKKWWANQNPEADLAGIDNAIENMRDVSARRVILISTIDVLPQRAGIDEDFDCASVENHAYGKHRLRLEQAMTSMFDQVNIVRLPALFGPGLKKNVIYDLMHDNILETINPASAFQYYDLTRLWRDIEFVVAHDLPLVHLFPAPVATQKILDAFFPDKLVGAKAAAEAQYDYRTKYDSLFGRSDGYIAGADDVLASLGAFISAEQGRA